MKLRFKKIINISLWSLMITGIFVALGFVGKKQNYTPCSAVGISIEHPAGHYFIGEEDIKDLLRKKGDSLVGTPMQDINIALLEKIIRANPFVANAEVYSTINGEVNIDIVERNPIVRIINNRNESFYIDDKGNFMPLCERYTARLIIANGYIMERYSQRNINNLAAQNNGDSIPDVKSIFELAKFIERDEFWKAQIQQIYVNEDKDIELIPEVGDHRIILGDAYDMDEKFKKLLILYRQGFNNTGWNNYSCINLKYKDQVVCTKKEQ